MSIISFILIISIAINLLLAVFVFSKNRKSLINIFFSATIAGSALWGFGMLFFRLSTNETVDFWSYLIYLGIDVPIFFFLLFSFVYPSGSFPKNIFSRLFLIISSVAVFVITFIPGYIVKENEVINGEIIVTLGSGFPLHIVILSIFFIWAFKNLNVSYKKSDGIVKSQLLYLSIGVFLTFSIGLVTNMVMFSYTTKYAWIGPSATIFMSGFITYAITRYRLMDIKVVLRRSIVAFSTLMASTFIFVTITYLLLYFIKSSIESSLLVEIIIIFILILTLTNFVKKLITVFFNKLFFAPLYNKEIALNKLAQRIPEVLNLKELVDLIINTIQLGLEIEKISVWSLDNNKNEFTLLKTIGFKIQDIDTLIKNTELLKYFLIYNDPVIYHEIDGLLENYNLRVSSKMFRDLKDRMKQAKLEVILPLIVKKDIVGMILLGRKVDGTSYTNEDISTLRIIASHSAVALDNAGLYKETQQFANKMEKEVKRATSELRKVNKQLMKLDKAKSEFISIASHQLRTPLTVIKGYASMLLEGDYGKVDKEVKPAVNSIFASSNRMSSLVENLLNVSRIESGKIIFNLKNIDLNKIIENIVSEFGAIVKKKHLSLSYIHSEDDFHINADEIKIREVVSNLIDNAVKYTEKGGITIKLELAKNEEKAIILSVKDSGIGIDKEDSPNVFQKFRRGKKVALVYTDGLGLGMFFSQKIVEAHNGKIWVESDGEGKGSTFFVKLPK